MKRSILIVALVGTAFSLGGWMFTRSAKERHVFAAGRLAEVKVAPSAPELQQRIERTKKQADDLNQPELSREVEALRRQFEELEARESSLQNELQAWQQAIKAVGMLQVIIDRMPKTKAAEAAAAAIRVIHERRTQAAAPQAATTPGQPTNNAPATGSKPAVK
jgi:seryl-tRNA synthetase